jgi:hypothetical protein
MTKAPLKVESGRRRAHAQPKDAGDGEDDEVRKLLGKATN